MSISLMPGIPHILIILGIPFLSFMVFVYWTRYRKIEGADKKFYAMAGMVFCMIALIVFLIADFLWRV